MMLIAVLATVLVTFTSAKVGLSGCLNGGKTCIGYPLGCVGPQCSISYSFKANDTHLHMELYAKKVQDRTYIAVGYSANGTMGDEWVVYCIKDKMVDDSEMKAGLAVNVGHSNNNMGTVAELKKKDKNEFDMNLIFYDSEDDNLYCEIEHALKPIKEKLGSTRTYLLLAKGTWLKNGLSYHGNNRYTMGQYNLVPKKSELFLDVVQYPEDTVTEVELATKVLAAEARGAHHAHHHARHHARSSHARTRHARLHTFPRRHAHHATSRSDNAEKKVDPRIIGLLSGGGRTSSTTTAGILFSTGMAMVYALL